MAGKTQGLDQKLCDETFLENISFAADKMEKVSKHIICFINDSET